MNVFNNIFENENITFRYTDFINLPTNNLILFAKSGIKIKKKNRGKFTEYCGGKVTDACILKGKHSSSSTIRKRATFADNARAWKHQEGGTINFSDFFSNYYGLDNKFDFKGFLLKEPMLPINLNIVQISSDNKNNNLRSEDYEVNLDLIPDSKNTSFKHNISNLNEELNNSLLTNIQTLETSTPLILKTEFIHPTSKKEWSTISRYSDQSKWAKDFIASMKKQGVSLDAMNYLLARSAHESLYGKKPSGEYNYGNLTVGVLNYDGTKYNKNKGTKRVLDGPVKNSFKHYNSMDEYVKDAFAYMKRKWKVDLQKDDLNTIIKKTRGWSYFNINEYLPNTLKNAQGLAN